MSRMASRRMENEGMSHLWLRTSRRPGTVRPAHTCSGTRKSSSRPARHRRLTSPDTSTAAIMADRIRNRRLLAETTAPRPTSNMASVNRRPPRVMWYFMRPAVLIAFASCLGAAPLQVVRPIVSDSEGGAALPTGFEYRPGETLFFSCRIANYQKTSEEKVHLAYSVQAFDPKGVPLVELFKNDINTEVAPQDKEWMPRIATEIAVPPLIAAGTYRIEVKAEDLVGNSTAELSVPFQVRGRSVGPSDRLTVENFQFFR